MRKIALFLFVAFSGCSINNHSYSDGNKWIPQDFNPAKNILLVEHYIGKEKWNTALVEFLDKHYRGKYEIVDKADILGNQGKYADRNKYQFAILWAEVGSISHTSFAGGSGTTNFSSPQIDDYGHFLDRSSGKEYPTTKRYNNYGWKGYVPFFNTIIKHFKN